ncbi:MAG: hypothetical protein A2504_09605 [Bdellovibrionales bacterium RIFOXYD12_FULL_39_22]|nr:MAG: hypothetical protein A2385_13095 [Bdellovibrionales bacterium RIFOXYB1_FULL_39_21]OFZ40982.1 MAG: hypothetical protein A2485_16605 [Bdellovibrionales bacterium RIFOXYC12_FULL_39_17]OFZ44810.1 MAG: hypothetical protein A2404_09895 [Bdellovibrionales bacterium RIFOXYC1_FULL_39_130]OFZ74275.1 MAG: hypothetical protein A2560_16860 [Bdellovibrionales bacterium RIFOXYD1_FULL_39_84]OFZ92139.1 MAG: hypothetical protein A2504_09605 [Bdellovibrionales bacterium RIFOXYD12_FULL_39_22]HLE12757.1 DE
MGENEKLHELIVRPSGAPHFSSATTSSELEFEKIVAEKGMGSALLFLDTNPNLADKYQGLNYWIDFVRIFLASFIAQNKENETQMSANVLLGEDDLARFLLTKPICIGSEYINEDLLKGLWDNLIGTITTQIKESKQSIEEFFSARHQGVTLQGRIWFHLAENKNDEHLPFAFLATYSNKVSNAGKTQHLPLNRALEEYSGKKDKQILLRLLAPLSKASSESKFIKNLVDAGDIYHPQRWTSGDAFKFLSDIPLFEKAGILVRVPNWWRPKNPIRAQVALNLGSDKPKGMGLDALLDFSVSVDINGERLSEKEISELLNKSERLTFFRGQWIEIDTIKLQEALVHFKQIEKDARATGISFLEGMRLLAGVGQHFGDSDQDNQELVKWRKIDAGPWLNQILANLKSPDNVDMNLHILNKYLHATLRPYQLQGVNWLYFLDQLGLGACLADDMGLGKTIQVIALLLLKKYGNSTVKSSPSQSCSLLVAPASLLGNWKSELMRFAPELNFFIAHSSENLRLQAIPTSIDSTDLVITTYGSLQNIEWLKNSQWNLAILDEAQAIKNPGTKQTKAVKMLKAKNRFVLTGTPIENSAADLWSLFDFIAPGLLGSSDEFSKFINASAKTAKDQSVVSRKYAILRNLVRPYILRRLKSDKNIIKDLPDKIELKTFCELSKNQIYLYQDAVESLERELNVVDDGIKRKGLIFSYMMRFKQICNHPSHWLKDGEFRPDGSGKFARLIELIEVIKAKQEKLLVFTQFQEMTEPLSNFLAQIFGQEGLVLHGKTAVKKRKELVGKFQREDGPPFFVLSLKAGGVGLTLTQASHVIHFDRWWNPAIENQATDRAFRIGQKRNVIAHKFICRGTLEEKIDALIDSKIKISNEIIGNSSGGELQFTEMSNSEILKLVSLDLKSGQT